MKLFISYRRSDSEETTGRIYDRLKEEFGRENVFRDIDTIPLTTKFADYLKEWLADTTVVVAVIGPDWMSVADSNGNRRIDDPEDYVRLEILTALSLGISIVPVIVRRAQFPRRNDLPEELRALNDWNGQPVRPDPDFHGDMNKLIRQIQGATNADAPEERTSRVMPRLDSGLNDDQVRLLLELYVKEHRVAIHEDGYDHRCVRTEPMGQYWGFEYTSHYIEITRDEDRPKRNPEGARFERLRWLGAFEELNTRGYLETIKKDIYELSASGRKVGYELVKWMQTHDKESIPKTGIFD